MLHFVCSYSYIVSSMHVTALYNSGSYPLFVPAVSYHLRKKDINDEPGLSLIQYYSVLHDKALVMILKFNRFWRRHGVMHTRHLFALNPQDSDIESNTTLWIWMIPPNITSLIQFFSKLWCVMGDLIVSEMWDDRIGSIYQLNNLMINFRGK